MSPLIPLLVGCALLPSAEPDKPVTLRYLRPAKDRLVLESEVTTTSANDGTVYVSRTERGKERMTLTLRRDAAGRLTSAEAVHEGAMRRSVVLTFEAGGRARLKRDGTTDFLKGLPENPVVTTAPDWSDAFQLARRYDAAKGGKQEFAGLWIHPVQPRQQLTFAVERAGENTVTAKEDDKPAELKLNRFRVRLRSGGYVVWADAAGRVIRLAPAGAKDNFVVLQGFEEATKGLVP